MPTRIHLILTSLILLAPLPAPAAGSGLELLLRSDTRELEVWHGPKRILSYAFGTNQFKPYIRELNTLDGVNVLRDAPADHLHHHGLMYAVRVNGINFWEETKSSGYQIPHSEVTREVKRAPTGPPQARFSQLIHWVPPDGAQAINPESFALLKETRTIRVIVDPGSEEIAVHWESEFEAGPAVSQVILNGTSYNGLGLRLPAEFDGGAFRQNQTGHAYSEEGRDEVTVTPWTAAAQTMAGRVTTVALFHHPDNAGQPRIFSMINPFAYLSATQNLEEAPLEYRRGQTFTVRYLVTVTPRRLTAETLERRYQRWIR